MTSARKSLPVLTAIVLLVACQHVAQADPLVLSLQNNSLTGVAGGSVTFVASVFNSDATNTNTATIGDIATANPPGFSVNFAPFFANFSGQTVANGITFGPLPIVTLPIQAGLADGSYSGSFHISYSSAAGPFFSSNDVLWTVRLGPAPVPEPTTILLLSIGLVGIATKVKRRRSQ